MSDYDLIDLWVTHMNFLATLFVAFLSATSAFLVVANLKGKELPPSLSRLVIYLYCVASIFFIGFMGKVAEGIFNLRGQMHEAGLSWYVVVYEPQFILPSLFIAGAVIIVSLVIGAVWYFASQRRGDISG